MPGFFINGIGRGTSANVKPIYKYTWKLDQLFSKQIGFNSPVIYVRDATLPSWSFGREEIPGASLRYKFAKDITFNDVKITWYDTAGLATAVKQWRAIMWSPESGLTPPSQYKTESLLTSLTSDLTDGTTWKLINSWPAAVSVGELTYTESGFKIVDVTVAYDWAEELDRPRL